VIRRRNQFRTITVSAPHKDGVLPSEVIGKAKAQLEAIADSLAASHRLEIGGEQEKQERGFGELGVVLGISVVATFCGTCVPV